MAKALKFRSRAKSYPVDHPDGGTFHLFPVDPERASQYSDFLDEIRKGEKKTAEQLREVAVYVAEHVVDKITNVIDIETEEPVEITGEIELQILMEYSEREIEVDVPVFDDQGELTRTGGKIVTRKEKRPANEPYFLWAIAEGIKLIQRRQEATGN